MLAVVIRFFALSLGLLFLATGTARAAEITAIDFNGDLIGKVIPDGTVVSFDNEVIGNVTADSFIVDGKGELIGGVIPQGVAVGNDNKLLGKVNNDGSVRLPSGKIIGKVLPNALVVDDDYNILGAVLYPGLIYNNAGRTIGRLTGDGSYTSIEGQNVGFVSPLGYAYRHNGEDYTLEGKLISSKMVISLDGKFMGSVAPGGKVTDFSARVIGNLHANGYVYDDNGQIIGRTVNNSYAFDNFGKYLGLVTYNGEVLSHGEMVGRLRADNKIVNDKNEVIGFPVDIAATATDLKGAYLGRLLPDGKIARAREATGTLGPRGMVFDADGKIIGQLVVPGPVFDYAGKLTAQALRSGVAISVTGTPLGYIKGQLAYNNIGRLLGSGTKEVLLMDSANNVLGLSGIGTTFENKGVALKVSPFGYVFTSDNILTGHAMPLTALYNEAGSVQSYLGANGTLQNTPQEQNLKLEQFGLALDTENKIVGSQVLPYFAVSPEGGILGTLSENNLLMDEKGMVTGKIVPEYKVVPLGENPSSALMPVIGTAGHSMLAVGINGSMIGYVGHQGIVTDFSGNVVGSIVDGDIVVDNEKSIIGRTVDLNGVINDACAYLGVVGMQGEIRNNRDIVLGRILTNGQAISEVGNVIGFAVKGGLVTDFEGKPLGTVNALGQLLNINSERLGCIRRDGRFYNSDGTFVGARVETAPVMNFENMMIGRVNLNAEVINDKSKNVGTMLPNGTAVNDEEVPMGTIFKYKVAFDNENGFMGRVLENGMVVSDKNDVLGKVAYDGTVTNDNEITGYALYDFYIYDENGQTIGYLTKNGVVANFSGGHLGKADHGFLVDKNYELIGRGARDYFIRDEENNVIGELMFNGEVVDNDGKVIGSVNGSGEIRDADGRVLAIARPLQYYNIIKPETPRPADWAGTGRTGIKVDAVPQPQPQSDNSEFSLKAIGIALTPDGNYLGDILSNLDVVDKAGNLVGKKMPDGLIIDDSGNLIGIEEVKNPGGDQMFVPAGTFGSGGAYGTGNAPTNLGPGGGFGPGERYDPVRAAALAAAQAARRSEITVGKLTTNVDKEAFDGKQAYWEGVPRQLSTWRVDMSEMILADKPIPAVLARTIMSGASDVPVTAIVERNVYAEDGRNIVIPAGSRVMGTSSGGSGGGSSGGAVRVSITWTRLIRPDGSAFEFSSAQTGDAQGRGGALGYLDEQLLKKYGLPVVTSFMSSALAYVTATDQTTENGGENAVESSRQQAANDARQNFLDNMDQIFNQILQDKTNIEAVTYVPAGTRLIIFPKEDLWIRTLDRSKEENDMQAMQKPTVFIDDRNPVGKTGGSGAKAGGGSGSGGSTSGVVYQDEDVDAQAASKPFIDDAAMNKKNKRKTASGAAIPPVTSTGATPPPPPSTTVNNAPDGTSAQLF